MRIQRQIVEEFAACGRRAGKAGRFAAFAALVAVVAALWAGLGATAAGAASSGWVETEQTRLRLVAAGTGVGAERTLRLGLQFRLKPGWKVYWRSPGDAGYPPNIDWAGSENLAGVVVLWPVPERFQVLGFNTVGYKDEVVFPLDITVAEPGRPVRLRAQVDYLTCSEICVPYSAELALDLPAGPAQTTAFTHLIDRFAARVPGPGTARGLTVDRVEMRGEGEARVLRVTVRSDRALASPDLFVEGPDLIEFGLPKVETAAAGRIAFIELPARAIDAEKSPALLGAPLTLTLVDGLRVLETTAVVERAVETIGRSYLVILLLAFVGGLILNLMPCVLPVLSLKLLRVVGHGGGERAAVRQSFLASAAGILAAFLALAAVLAVLKSAGATVGWGIQFQQPLFLVVMTVVVTLFAANLWGLFEIRLPGVLSDTLAGAGGGAGSGGVRGLAGDFATGAFATLLATPCSAPFLGTAIGFAFSGAAADIFAIFAALGLGLAAPYLLVAAVPALAIAMPRPGPWMVWLKAVLGVALAATAVWLMSVIATLAAPTTAYVVGALMVAVVAVLALGRGRRTRLAMPGLVGALALAALATPSLLTGIGPPPQTARSDTYWQPFDWARIPALVAEGKTVFVDVTADWCITCQANKALVLGRGEVAGRLAGADVVAMVADWTRPSDEISSYLASFGRYGIPFDVVYGPGAPRGVPLPELLTRTAVLDAFARAENAAPSTAKAE